MSDNQAPKAHLGTRGLNNWRQKTSTELFRSWSCCWQSFLPNTMNKLPYDCHETSHFVSISYIKAIWEAPLADALGYLIIYLKPFMKELKYQRY